MPFGPEGEPPAGQTPASGDAAGAKGASASSPTAPAPSPEAPAPLVGTPGSSGGASTSSSGALTSPTAGAPAGVTYWLTRALFLRALGALYVVAFLAMALQLRPLIGEHGLTPARAFLDRVAEAHGHGWASFAALPGLFWGNASDSFMQACAWAGVVLAAVVALGFANAPLMLLLWFLYMSFVHVGQIWLGFGWETLLLETGFLAVFLCPLVRGGPLPARTPPPVVVLWLLRWLVFRVMFGAGLIKLRGDPCWRDLSCLVYHYETQPLPNPLSWLLHQSPPWFHAAEVLWNHAVELVVPFGLFGPRRVRTLAGALTVAFQTTLILSGNLSWLNDLTIAITLACFDDGTLGRLVPRRVRARAAALAAARPPAPRGQRLAVGLLAVVVGVLSVQPALNLIDAHQRMNDSFEPLHLVNTYGAFGSIGKQRNEIILEGTSDDPSSPTARWVPYEWKCKPGDVHRRPCVVAPYQYRLDWEVWFAAMSDYRSHPWLVHLVWKLLHADAGALSLLAPGPWTGAPPPRAIRAELYEYRFTHLGDRSGAWWSRQRVGEWLPVLTADNPTLQAYLRGHGWLP